MFFLLVDDKLYSEGGKKKTCHGAEEFMMVLRGVDDLPTHHQPHTSASLSWSHIEQMLAWLVVAICKYLTLYALTLKKYDLAASTVQYIRGARLDENFLEKMWDVVIFCLPALAYWHIRFWENMTVSHIFLEPNVSG